MPFCIRSHGEVPPDQVDPLHDLGNVLAVLLQDLLDAPKLVVAHHGRGVAEGD